MEKLIVILAAAGKARRMGLGMNKAFVQVAGAPIIVHNLQQLQGVSSLERVVIVVGEQELEFAATLLAKYQAQYFPQLSYKLVAGGKERQDSVANALTTITEEDGFVAIHDAARPFATPELFARVQAQAEQNGAAIPGVAVKDTIKQALPSGQVEQTIPRAGLFHIQTPQIFRLQLLRQAYAHLADSGAQVTDDAAAVELIGAQVFIAEGSYDNNKITTAEDLVWAEALLQQKGRNNVELQMQIGSGFDVHQLVEGRKLILCGAEIPYVKGLEGHSDADVATHALMDAILGAIGEGDIGTLFPDTAAAYKDADSIVLLREVLRLLAEKGWRVGNADVTIMAQKPKLLPYREQMEAILAKEMQLTAGRINVKATTTERLGFVGREEGIAAQAVVTVVRS